MHDLIPELESSNKAWNYKIWPTSQNAFDLFPHSFGGTKSASVNLPQNDAGRDFAIGDIHGMWDAVRSLLATVEFDPARDRLFAVGNLIDRGPKSDEFEAWIDWSPF